MQYLRHLMITGLSFLFLQCVWADPTQDLQRDLDANQSLTGTFVQTMTADRVLAPIKSTGRFALKRPGNFYWASDDSSHPLLIIANGKTIFVYDKNLKQVTVRNQKNTAQSGSPAMFLVGDTKEIVGNYQVSETLNGKQITYTITPNKKKQANPLFDQLFITFNIAATEHPISAMRIIDALGGVNEISFTRSTKKPDEKLFTFVPPAGVDLVKEH